MKKCRDTFRVRMRMAKAHVRTELAAIRAGTLTPAERQFGGGVSFPSAQIAVRDIKDAGQTGGVFTGPVRTAGDIRPSSYSGSTADLLSDNRGSNPRGGTTFPAWPAPAELCSNGPATTERIDIETGASRVRDESSAVSRAAEAQIDEKPAVRTSASLGGGEKPHHLARV